jgi:hypothetical protein
MQCYHLLIDLIGHAFFHITNHLDAMQYGDQLDASISIAIYFTTL